MASRRKEYQENVRFKVMQIINQNPKMTSRELAQKVGISNGTAYYLLISLIDAGVIKISNFKKNSQKAGYIYLLTPKGIREKSLLTQKFLSQKKIEYLALREEIIKLERSIGIDTELHNNDDQ